MEVWRDELYHHGIKGQKWGVRRFQNEDGSLTPAGQKRYGGIYGVNDRYYSTKASKLQKRADAARTMASMNKAAGGKGVYGVNERYYTNRANKLQKKADVARTMASMNRAAAQSRIDKYSKKAQVQIDAHNRNIKTLTKNGHDYDDEDFYKLQSASEKANSRIRAGKEIVHAKSMIKYWESAMTDISNSSTAREGKKKFKKYRQNAADYYPFG